MSTAVNTELLRRKNLFKGAGFTMGDAAKKLGMSRTTLYTHLDSLQLDLNFVQSVKDALGIDLAESTEITTNKQGNIPYIDQLLAAKDALLAEKDKRIEREQWFTNSVLANFERYDQEIADYRKWQIEVGQSILSLTKAVAPLLGKDQKKAVGQQVGGKQRI